MKGNTCRELGRTLVGREAFYEAASLLNGMEFSGDCDMEKAIRNAETENKLGKNDGVSFIISDLLSDCNYKGAIDLITSHKREVFLI